MKFFGAEGISKPRFVLLFLLKLLAGGAVWWVYTYYYSNSDFNVFFSDSGVLLNHLFGNGHQQFSNAWSGSFESDVFNGAKIMVILNAVLRIFSFENFYVHIVFFCFLSFIGTVALLKAFLLHFPNKKIQLIAGLFLVPSVLFWNSAALKGAVEVGIVGLLIYWTDFGLKKEYSTREKVSILLLFIFLSFIRIYIAAILPIVLVSNFWISRTSRKRIELKYVVIFLSFCLFGFFLSFVSNDLNVLKVLSRKQAKAISEARGGIFLANDKNFVSIDYSKQKDVREIFPDTRYQIKPGSSYLSWEIDNMNDTTFVTNSMDSSTYSLVYKQAPANSVIELKRLSPTALAFIGYAPVAFFNTLTRPFVFETHSLMELLAGIENLWILLIIVLAIIFYDKSIIDKKEVVMFCFVFAGLLFVIIGCVTPSIGAMVRYRAIGLTFLMPICLMMINGEKLRSVLKLKK